MKLFALILAVILWVQVVGQDKSEVGLKVPLQLSNLSDKLVVSNELPTEVELRLYGPDAMVRRLSNRLPPKVLDLNGLKEGFHVFQVLGEDFTLPPVMRVIRVSPARITLVLSQKKSKNLPIRPILRGEVPKGFEVAGVEFSPNEAVISGRDEDLKELDWIWTNPIDISGLKRDTTLEVRLQLPRGKTVRLSPAQVTAKVLVRSTVKQPDEQKQPAEGAT